VLQPLKEALSLAFWFKKDLRAFLSTSLNDSALAAHLDWTDYKRNIVAQLVSSMAGAQHKYLDDLLNLLLATADIEDPQHLKRLEDGQRKYDEAVDALATLRGQVEPYRRMRSEAEEADRRRRQEQAKAEVQQAITEKLIELKTLLVEITAQDPHSRGYALEKLLNELFALYDIDAKTPFRVVGEQIDGAFTFEATEFLCEARWRNELTAVADLDSFSAKITRKLENTLGLFLSVNGFQPSAVEVHSQSRPVLFLMDGSDLAAVLDGRISLPDLLTRKRQHAARTGEILLSAYTILGT